ncbi:hypothetical protein BGZ46_008170 [Entomortierella lignicola]|nr:hypothetical protein BGZ46_008170 [Entomortierella lignicola]
MVFHMRNEVSKIRCPSEEDKTGLSEKRGGFAPQQQPRQYQRPISPKKTGSSKRVSFKEEPEVIAAVATAVESLAVVSQEDPELNSTETKSYEAVIQPAVDSLVRSSSTSYTSTQSNQSRSSYVLQRNMSAPSISAFAPSTINSNKECSQPQKGSKSSSGNRISKLWKSVAQKYGHGHGIRADHGSSVMVGREPLVV